MPDATRTSIDKESLRLIEELLDEIGAGDTVTRHEIPQRVWTKYIKVCEHGQRNQARRRYV